jgi:hypothetical protein
LEPRIASGTKFAPILVKGSTVLTILACPRLVSRRQVRPILLN